MRRLDPWAFAVELLVLVVLAIILTAEVMHPVPPAPDARERASQFAAQEAYYETLERYGDVEGAVEAARTVFEEER